MDRKDMLLLMEEIIDNDNITQKQAKKLIKLANDEIQEWTNFIIICESKLK